jgi:arabinofuranan 3-O-arabinosyltransferase
VSARFAYDGDPRTAWRSAGDDAFPSLTFRWDRKRTVTGLQVESNDRSDLAPNRVVVRADGFRRDVPIGADRSVNLPTLHTRRLTLTFTRGTAGPGGVAVSEVRLDGFDVTAVLDYGAKTGSVCGLGPEVFVDGVPHPTQVRGSIADIVSGGTLRLEGCRGPVKVDQGRHRVQARSTEEFQVVSLRNSGAAAPSSVDPVQARKVTVAGWEPNDRRLEVGKGDDAVLSLAENYNPGWVAEADGRTLKSLRVDGWRQGWLLPAGVAGAVHLSFAPQLPYVVSLVLGLAVAAAFLLAALLLLLRSRPAAGPPVGTGGAPLPTLPTAAVTLLCWALLLVLGGPWVAAGVPAGWLARRLPGGWWLLPAVAMLGAAALDVFTSTDGWHLVADAAAAFGVGAALSPVLRLRRQL